MKYTVEFEIHSDIDAAGTERVRQALLSAFDNVDNVKVVPCRTYVASFQGNKPVVWSEVPQEEPTESY